jgi:hypothetical protein
MLYIGAIVLTSFDIPSSNLRKGTVNFEGNMWQFAQHHDSKQNGDGKELKNATLVTYSPLQSEYNLVKSSHC